MAGPVGLHDSASAFAADVAVPRIDGVVLGLIWVLPFLGILVSIALMPLLASNFWHRHFGKVSAFWAMVFLIPFAMSFGFRVALYEALHALLVDYLPFIVLLSALFVIAGGIRVVGNLAGTPATNTAIIAFGTMAASLLGTTGAAMLLIRPLIKANEDRRRKVHVFVFFIFLVANIGGSLTPLGDPPLLLGFHQGVDFAWTLRAMFGPMLLCSAILLALFYVIDRWAWGREKEAAPRQVRVRLRFEGGHNLLMLACAIGAVLVSGLWQPDISLTAFQVAIPLQNFLCDLFLLLLTWLSWRLTPKSVRIENVFTWEPIQEVAMVFAGIFATIIPVLAILKAGLNGTLAGVIALVIGSDGGPSHAAYFWLTGLSSSFLDNAPTYLAFFNVAGGDAELLMGPLATTLLAISTGSVFFGAITYIGNAPNLMVKSICQERGIQMPGFFGYMIWSCTILVPLFALITAVFFPT